MTRAPAVPMPHDPDCPGHSHLRRKDTACQLYRAEYLRRKRDVRHYQHGDCDFCPAENVLVYRHAGHPACKTCYNRWQARGFTGNGPGPGRPPALVRALDYAPVILTRSAAQAAVELRVTPRTVTRWRMLLRTRIAWYLAVRGILEGRPVIAAGE